LTPFPQAPGTFLPLCRIQVIHFESYLTKNPDIFSLIPISLVYSGQPEVGQHIILSYRFCASREQVVAELSFGRNLLGFFLTVCLPTLIANIIGHLSNVFAEACFETAIGVNLTLLLVITTM
jgi:hypothetical protein